MTARKSKPRKGIGDRRVWMAPSPIPFAFLSSYSIFPHKQKKLFPNYCNYFHNMVIYERRKK